jgi:hypothetical protein
MNINEKIDLYLNEIISKEDWKAAYRLEFYQSFDSAKYREIISQVISLFTKLNKGRPKKTIVFDYQNKKPRSLTNWDLSLMEILNRYNYTVAEGLYMTGFVLKDGKKKSIYDILKSMESRAHPEAKKRMKDQYEKKPVPEIKKQLDFVQDLEDYGILMRGKINFNRFFFGNNTERKIVFTYDHRAVASQSTKVGWTSCMSLDKGSSHELVARGISKGVFIAYLVNPGDEYTLKSPVGRTLFKPYEGRYTGKLYWMADRVYPNEAPDNFRKEAQKIVNNVQGTLPKESDIFDLSDEIYIDNLQRTISSLGDEEMELKNYPDKIKEIENPTEKQILIAVDAKPSLIKFIKNPSEKAQISAVKWSPHFLKDIKNPTEKVLIAAVEEDGDVITLIKNPSEKVQLAAVKNNAFSIVWIKDPSEKVQLAAVNTRGLAIKHIKNPSEKVQLEAIKEDGYSIEYIKNPSEKIQMASVQKMYDYIRFIENPTEKVQLYAVNKNPMVIVDIQNPTEKVQLAAVNQRLATYYNIKNPTKKVKELVDKIYSVNIKEIKNPTEEQQLLALKKDMDAIVYIENPTEKVKLEAVKIYARNIEYINKPTEEMQLIAVKYDYTTIQYIKNPTEKVQLEAMKKNINAIGWIRNPSPKAIKYYSDNLI